MTTVRKDCTSNLDVRPQPQKDKAFIRDRRKIPLCSGYANDGFGGELQYFSCLINISELMLTVSSDISAGFPNRHGAQGTDQIAYVLARTCVQIRQVRRKHSKLRSLKSYRRFSFLRDDFEVVARIANDANFGNERLA